MMVAILWMDLRFIRFPAERKKCMKRTGLEPPFLTACTGTSYLQTSVAGRNLSQHGR
jgi:hypothetical protein